MRAAGSSGSFTRNINGFCCSLAPNSSPCRPRLVATCAKKGGQEKKGAQRKGGSALADLLKRKEAASQPAGALHAEDSFAAPDQYKDPEVVMQLMMILQSYKKQFHEFLMETGFDQLAEAVYKAPFVLVAHNKFEQGVTDPVFTYANRAALELFEATWDEFIGMLSRYSAEEAAQEERNNILAIATEKSAVSGYDAWRKSLKGKRFKIKDGKLFNVTELDGTLWGQAAVFKQYETEDGTVHTVQGEAPPPSAVEIPPSLEDVQAAGTAVQEQAATVRQLKEGQGLTNQDFQVQEAVANLQERKKALAELQEKYEAALQEAEDAANAPPTIESIEDEDAK